MSRNGRETGRPTAHGSAVPAQIERVQQPRESVAVAFVRVRMGGVDAVQQLERAATQLVSAREELARAAAQARAAGVSWEVIAAAAGMTRETARRQFGPLVDVARVGDTP